MQIFIDSQYLPPTTDKDYNYNANLCSHRETDLSKSNIFTLGHEGSRDERYINLKKGYEIQDVLLQYSVNNSDCNDKAVRSQNPSGERKSSLGNLKSLYGDRQRNSFLRDLYIETYPRNGNVNGLTAGVLAISNECYRAPASVLLTNANGKHLSAGDTLLEPYKKTNEHISNSPTVFHLRKQQRCTRGEQDYGETSKNYYDSPVTNVCSVEKINSRYFLGTDSNVLKKSWMDHTPIPSSGIFQVGLQEQFLSGLCLPSLDYSVSASMIDSVKSMRAFRNKSALSSSSYVISKEGNEGRCKEMYTNSTPKITILNHVLDSPWSPRIPNNYKPFRRKVESKVQSQCIDQNVSVI